MLCVSTSRLARISLVTSLFLVVPAAHAQYDTVISDCLSTYLNRGCYWFCSREGERDSDVCYVRENDWLSDRQLGGFAHGKNVPRGRYFYAHNVINAVVWARRENPGSIFLKCIMDFRGRQDDRDYFTRSDDKAFYDFYYDNHNVDLEGIDHCFVRIGDGRRTITITLDQLLRQMLNDR